MIVRLLFLGLILLSASGKAALPDAAPYRYHAREWSVEQGLPQITVTAIVQDKQGFIWAGTQAGLARFDGTRFRVFDSDNTPQLPGPRINALTVDRDGRLLIGSNEGLAMHVHEHFVALAAPQPGIGEVNALAATPDAVFIAAEHGLFRIENNGVHPARVPGWPAPSADAVATDARGDIWAAVKGGVYGRASTAAAFRFYPLPDPGLSVHALAWFDGHLWLGTNGGLYMLGSDASMASASALAKRSIRALLVGPSNTLWIGTDAGIFRLDQRGHLVDFAHTAGLKEKWIWALASDREGDIWAGTFSDGMLRLWDNGITLFGQSAGLENSVVDTVYRDNDGSILMGGKSGVYQHTAGGMQRMFGPTSLPNPLVNGFLRRSNGELWIATAGGLAIRAHGKPQPLPPAMLPLAHADVYDAREDVDGAIWISTTQGLYLYHDGRLQHFGKQQGLDASFIRGTFRGHKGHLWVATSRGAFEVSDEHFHKVCAAQHLEGQVLDIDQYPDGTTWIVVADGVLYRHSAGRCSRHVFNHAPLSQSLYSAAHDEHGNLWLTNDRGIYRIPFYRLESSTGDAAFKPDVVIEKADGNRQIHPIGGTPQAAVLDGEGNLWVPTVDGMVVVDVDNPPADPKPAPVIIESISRGALTAPVGPFPRPITYAPGKTDLRISYTALDYREPESSRFQYRLSGYDSEWVSAGTRRDALYTHLPPGKYLFEVRSEQGAGNQPPPAATLSIVLPPFFYQATWFKLIIAAVAASLVYLAYWLRVYQIRARQIQLEALVANRTDELKQANDKLQQASVTDPLTGLKNRRYFMEMVEKDVAAMRRSAQDDAHSKDMIFFMLDLDDFKHVNDTYGHHAGDAVLSQLSALLTRIVRTYDNVIRWGGEEFIVVARCTDRKGGGALAEKLRATIAAHAFRVNAGLTLSCTCSLGFCAFPLIPGAHDHPSWERVVNLADAALYKAKRNGKNRWIGIQPTPAASSVPPIQLQVDLDVLLASGWATLEETPSEATTTAAD